MEKNHHGMQVARIVCEDKKEKLARIRCLAFTRLTISVGLGLCQNGHAMCRATSNCHAEHVAGDN